MVVLASSSVGQVLLVLKIAFLVLLYLFVWRVIRTAGKEPKASTGARTGAGAGPPADSMILTPSAAAAAGLGSGAARQRRAVHLVVQRSPSLEADAVFPVDSAPVTIGRGGQNDLVLDGDEFASARHARIEARGDGVWVQDLDSTNGTFVNGARVVGAERMSPGDVLRVGETDLRVEEA
ncbi:MAG TPA: FHA domain-containing protein [Gaiellaceae bacterium]|nr:FHA domain-containing protein [Gaiellaceae bacterium]